MPSDPTSRIQNQGRDLRFEVESSALEKVGEALAHVKGSAHPDHFQGENIFQRFMTALKEKTPSLVDSLKQASATAAQKKEEPVAKADKTLVESKGARAETLPQSLETVFVEFFGKGTYAQVPEGQEALYAPKSSTTWNKFLNETLPKLGAWVQEMKMEFGNRVRAAIYRGLIETAAEARLVGDFLMNPANTYGRNPRLAFLQVLLPQHAVEAFRGMQPGDAIGRNLLDLIGKEASVRRIMPNTPQTAADSGPQALLRLKSGVSDGQVRFESLVMANRKPIKEELKFDSSLAPETLRRSRWAFPFPFFGGEGRDTKLGNTSTRKVIFFYWILALVVVVVLYFLIQTS